MALTKALALGDIRECYWLYLSFGLLMTILLVCNAVIVALVVRFSIPHFRGIVRNN